MNDLEKMRLYKEAFACLERIGELLDEAEAEYESLLGLRKAA